MSRQINDQQTAENDDDKCTHIIRLVSILLYLIPLSFFLISYFLIITSGEDIYQGANTPPDIINDAIAAFNYNSRLSDMYAWAVANFLDYKFSFGPDIIIRLIDVIMGMGVLYLATTLILGRRPRLKVSDAAWFLFIFVMLFATQHGRTLYAGFSVIHNYLIILLSSLAIIVPFALRDKTDRIASRHKISIICLMLICGLVFGLASNLTPIAFIITTIICGIYRLAKRRTVARSWEIAMVVGTVVGLAIIYGFGVGVSSYINGTYSQTYNYIAISELFSSPTSSLLALVKHAISNYGRVIAPLILPVIIILALYLADKHTMPNLKHINRVDSSRFVFLTLIAVINIAITVQIKFPLRIILPAYVLGVCCVGIVIRPFIAQIKVQSTRAAIVGLAVIATTIVAIRLILAINYSKKVSPVLQAIESSPDQQMCISPEAISSRTLPAVYLGQEPLLADWAMPETIYGKTIHYCN